MSKAERKKLAKGKSEKNNSAGGANTKDDLMAAFDAAPVVSRKKEKMKGNSFKDKEHFITMVPDDKALEEGYAVAEKTKYGNLEDAMLDLNPDSREELHRVGKRMLQHWDRKKKKYITVAMNEIDRITGKRKKPPPTGSGKKKSKTLQNQYDKWTAKSNRSIARAGGPEEYQGGDIEVAADWRNGYKSANSKNKSDGIIKTFQPKFIAKELGKGGRITKNELRTEQDIRKFKKMKERKQQQMRGIRPHKKLAPNVSRPSKQKIQFKRIK